MQILYGHNIYYHMMIMKEKTFIERIIKFKFFKNIYLDICTNIIIYIIIKLLLNLNSINLMKLKLFIILLGKKKKIKYFKI